MPIFLYRAVAHDGSKTEGEIEAPGRSEAFRKLEQQNLQPVSLNQKQAGPPVGLGESPRNHRQNISNGLLLSRSRIILFTEELSDLLEAGLQLEPALRAMEHRQELGGLKEVVIALREKVVQGASFSSALRGTCSSFGELYCNLVAAGEISGAMPKLLRKQAQYLQAIDELQNKVLQSLIYPSFIFGAGGILMIVFMSYLVPQLTSLLKETGKSMPLPTRVLIAFSNFISHYGLLVLAVGAVATAAFWFYIQQEQGRRWWDETKLKLPLMGAVIAMRYYAQFSQTLANLVGNGIPLLNSLKLMYSATPNVYFQGLLSGVIDAVAEGGSFSRALKKVGHFPPLFIDMVGVGEQTGDMGTALEKASIRYDRELSRSIQRLTALIQPIIIIVMALMVGLVAYSMISGIFQTISGLKMR